jgi:predicted AlkP superfamily phosphohydrolase/phosphomutase
MKKLTIILLSIISLEILVMCFLLFHTISFQKPHKRVFLIVIDAGEWSILNPLIEQGELPNFKILKEKGSYGYLKSPTSFSPIEWTSIASGKTKEKHEINDWIKDDRLVTSRDIKSKRIWNILNEYGITTGVYHYLLTWPPEKVNGFMFSGIMTQNLSITYPQNLTKLLDEQNLPHDYWSTQSTHMPTALYLLKKYKPDFFAFGDRDIYSTQIKSELRYRPKNRVNVTEKWKEMDNFLGELMKYNATIFVVSDHGFLTNISSSRIFFDSPLFLWEIFHISTSKDYRFEIVDKVFSEYPGTKTLSIFFKDKLSKKEKEKIIQTLNSIKYVKTNEPFFFNITSVNEKKIEVMFNITSKIIQDFENKNATAVSLILPNGKIFQLLIEKIAEFHPPGTPGVIIAQGPEIKENYQVEGAVTYDITPTILYLYNIPIPKDMDGRVLKEMIKEEYLRKHPIKYSEKSSQWIKNERKVSNINETMTKKIKERLRSLGYSV